MPCLQIAVWRGRSGVFGGVSLLVLGVLAKRKDVVVSAGA